MSKVKKAYYQIVPKSDCNSVHDITQSHKISQSLLPGQIKPLSATSLIKLRLSNDAIEHVHDFLFDNDEANEKYGSQRDAIFLNKGFVQELGTDILSELVVPTSYLSRKEFVVLISDEHLEKKYEDKEIAKKMGELKTLKAKFLAESKKEEEAKK